MTLILIALGGFAAAVVDGTLGMGFGPTLSVVLLSSGVSPLGASTTVNLTKVVTGLASAVTHRRMGNVDRALTSALVRGGVLGALVGAALLTVVDGDTIRLLAAALLTAVGLRLLVRFSTRRVDVDTAKPTEDLDRSHRAATGAGLVGGVSNGMIGAWGPVVTPALLHQGVRPRTVVGTVNTAEVAVAVVSSVVLIGTQGSAALDLPVAAALMLGGVAGAPLAARVAKYVRPRLLGIGIALALILTQMRELAAAWGGGLWIATAVVIALVLGRGLIRSNRNAAPRASGGPDASESARAPASATS